MIQYEYVDRLDSKGGSFGYCEGVDGNQILSPTIRTVRDMYGEPHSLTV